MDPAGQAAAAFRAAHGREPEGVWSAPGRVNLIGEHTDYNDGLVLPFTLPHRVAVAATRRSDDVLTFGTVDWAQHLTTAADQRIDDLRPKTIDNWSAYPAGVAWALRARGIEVPGADLVMASTVPTGAGLSSSAAVECATAVALLGLAGTTLPLPEIARIAQQAENDFVGMPCGILDQTASLCCTAGHVLFLDVRSGEAVQVPFDAAASGLEVLVIDTRVSHSLAESEYADRRRGCEQAAKTLGVTSLRDVSVEELGQAEAQLPAELAPLVRHVVTENDRVRRTVDHLRAGELRQIGPLLDASHESLRDDYRVSCAELDLAVTAARRAGALGARMTGGGFGGSAIALVDADAREDIAAAILAAFQKQGLRAPRIFPAIPSAGAGRDR
ncbi:galactokinase [Thermocrispum agreste]|jgi:galactokinase|uniref:Galactokinase n=1 Tax=Thermocrispum agreste TaxID=37925 RepID=A0A2W4ISR3_9PSEU|nr:galactokinase [Thermocrispum agreste]PZM89298.1 MAG: galactokinase [Thermocrispum agreste]